MGINSRIAKECIGNYDLVLKNLKGVESKVVPLFHVPILKKVLKVKRSPYYIQFHEDIKGHKLEYTHIPLLDFIYDVIVNVSWTGLEKFDPKKLGKKAIFNIRYTKKSRTFLRHTLLSQGNIRFFSDIDEKIERALAIKLWLLKFFSNPRKNYPISYNLTNILHSITEDKYISVKVGLITASFANEYNNGDTYYWDDEEKLVPYYMGYFPVIKTKAKFILLGLKKQCIESNLTDEYEIEHCILYRKKSVDVYLANDKPLNKIGVYMVILPHEYGKGGYPPLLLYIGKLDDYADILCYHVLLTSVAFSLLIEKNNSFHTIVDKRTVKPIYNRIINLLTYQLIKHDDSTGNIRILISNPMDKYIESLSKYNILEEYNEKLYFYNNNYLLKTYFDKIRFFPKNKIFYKDFLTPSLGLKYFLEALKNECYLAF